MNKLNDTELTNQLCKLNRFQRYIERQHRDQLEGALFLSLMEIEQAARRAQERLNELRYGDDFVPPEEQMGT